VRGIEPVHGGPAVGPVADVAGDALVAGDADQGRHEAVVAVAVIGRRKSHDRRADAAEARESTNSAVAQPGLRTGPPRAADAGSAPCPSRSVATAPVRARASRGDEERSIGTRQRLAERLDGAAIRVGGALEVPGEGDVVLEGEVDDAVGRGRGIPQAVEVVEGAAMHLCPGGGEGAAEASERASPTT
jgi:hypothetical protein